MIKRRRLLATAVLALAGADALFLITFYKRYLAYNATITYVGLDSTDMLVPVSMRSAKLRAGKWDVDPIPTINAAMFETTRDARARPVALVSLAPRSTYVQAISVVRALKARHVCNVLIREGGRLEPVTINFPDGPDKALAIPPLVLCGTSIGDAGFYGDLPADGPTHVDRR
jgi:hypothetical protein